MKSPKLVRFVYLAAVFLAAGYHLARAFPPAAVAPQPEHQDSLDVRYAEAQVALAEANLKRLQDMNQKVANVISGDTLVSFQQDSRPHRPRWKQHKAAMPAGNSTSGSAAPQRPSPMRKCNRERPSARTNGWPARSARSTSSAADCSSR